MMTGYSEVFLYCLFKNAKINTINKKKTEIILKKVFAEREECTICLSTSSTYDVYIRHYVGWGEWSRPHDGEISYVSQNMATQSKFYYFFAEDF